MEYFNEEEKSFGDKILGSLKDFGYIGVSSTYGTTANTQVLIDKIKEYGDMPWFYYGEKPIEETDLNFIKNSISVKEMDLNIRQQMYLRCQAKVNVGNETGMTLWCAKYSDTYVLGNKFYGPVHGVELNGKPRKDGLATRSKKWEKDLTEFYPGYTIELRELPTKQSTAKFQGWFH